MSLDLWSIIKVVFRRWYVTMPLLLVTGALGFHVISTVPPTYQSTATVLLVVPSLPPADANGGAINNPTSRQNPYLAFNGSLSITANAVAHVVSDDTHRSDLAKRGLQSDFSVIPANELPGVIVTVSGTQSRKVTRTAQVVVREVEDVLTSLQDNAGVPPPQRIVFTVLDPPTSALQLQPKVARVAAAIGATGVAITMAAGLLLEGIANVRLANRRRRGEGDRSSEGGPPDPGKSSVLAPDTVVSATTAGSVPDPLPKSENGSRNVPAAEGTTSPKRSRARKS